MRAFASITPVLSQILSRSSQQALTQDSLVSPNPFVSAESRKFKFSLPFIETLTQIWMQVMGSRLQAKSIWMQCTLAWETLVSRSPMRHRVLSMHDICTICSFHSLLLFQLWASARPSSKASSLHMTSAGPPLSSLSTAAIKKRKMSTVRNISRKAATQPLVTIFRIMSLFWIQIMIHLSRKFVKRRFNVCVSKASASD